MESLRTVRHHTAVDHCSWCRRANSTVCQRANSTGLAKGNGVPSATSVSTLEVSMNSTNSRDLGFQHQSFHVPSPWMTTSRSPDVSFAHTGGLTGSPLYSQLLRYRCLNQSVRTEDGHAMMKFDTFSLIPQLEPKQCVDIINLCCC